MVFWGAYLGLGLIEWLSLHGHEHRRQAIREIANGVGPMGPELTFNTLPIFSELSALNTTVARDARRARAEERAEERMPVGVIAPPAPHPRQARSGCSLFSQRAAAAILTVGIDEEIKPQR